MGRPMDHCLDDGYHHPKKGKWSWPNVSPERLPPTPAQVQDIQMGDRVFLQFDLQAITHKLHEHELSQAH